MPQLAPLMWTPMMIIFMITLMMFMIIVFFTKNTSSKTIPSIKKMKIIMNWKW